MLIRMIRTQFAATCRSEKPFSRAGFRLVSVSMTYPLFRRSLVVSMVLVLFHAAPVAADAIMRSEAMFADTIAEFYIEDNQVRLGQDALIVCSC